MQVGERPSAFGCCGVAIIALGGYLLSQKNSAMAHAATGAKQQQPAAAVCSSSSSSSSEPLTTPRDQQHATGRANGKLQGEAAQAGGSRAQAQVVVGGSRAQAQAAAGSRAAAASPGVAPQSTGKHGPSPSLSEKDVEAGAQADVRKKLGRSTRGGQDTRLSTLEYMRQEPGVVMMLGVAAIWSLTASLDKIGGWRGEGAGGIHDTCMGHTIKPKYDASPNIQAQIINMHACTIQTRMCMHT